MVWGQRFPLLEQMPCSPRASPLTPLGQTVEVEVREEQAEVVAVGHHVTHWTIQTLTQHCTQIDWG